MEKDIMNIMNITVFENCKGTVKFKETFTVDSESNEREEKEKSLIKLMRLVEIEKKGGLLFHNDYVMNGIEFITLIIKRN